MAKHALAGDIGGTKTNLAVYTVEYSRQVSLIREASFLSKNYDRLETIIMAEIPVHIILNPRAAQIGAAQAACELLG